MGLSPVAFFGNLDPSNPIGSDSRTISDDQHRNIIQSCRDQGPNWTGVINATHADLNLVSGFVAGGVRVMPGEGGVTTLYAYNTATPPLGWTVFEPDVNVRELIIGPAAGGATIGGSIDPTTLTDTSPVTVSSISGTAALGGGIPEGIPFSTTTGGGLGPNWNVPSGGVTVSQDDHTHSVSGNTDAVPDHTHAVSGTGSGTADVNITPRYARGILMRLAV